MRTLALLVVTVIGCATATPTTTEAVLVPSKDAIVKVTDRGPVKVTLTVWPPKPTLGDPIYTRLEVTAPPGITIDAPFQQAGDDTLGRFKIVAFTRDGGANQTYTLAAQTSGRHRVPPLRLEMTDTRPGKPPGKDEILTDEVPLEIAPVSTDAIGKELAPALGALDETVGGVSWLVIGGGALALAIAASGGLLLYRALRTRRRIAKQRSAYDEAVARLRELEDKGAPTGEDADRYFVELSAIVRRYLELRYEIRAPEQTTEEFLDLVAHNDAAKLSATHRGLLGGFLERCDQVKFAGYRPDREESIASLAAARGFVEDTRLVEVAR
ncbi:MAG: hypothetical protein NT062_10515 [Proteobacteria bacterium]|nr:hypothetical protein [Pseudomonadota bacterium]